MRASHSAEFRVFPQPLIGLGVSWLRRRVAPGLGSRRQKRHIVAATRVVHLDVVARRDWRPRPIEIGSPAPGSNAKPEAFAAQRQRAALPATCPDRSPSPRSPAAAQRRGNDRLLPAVVGERIRRRARRQRRRRRRACRHSLTGSQAIPCAKPAIWMSRHRHRQRAIRGRKRSRRRTDGTAEPAVRAAHGTTSPVLPTQHVRRRHWSRPGWRRAARRRPPSAAASSADPSPGSAAVRDQKRPGAERGDPAERARQARDPGRDRVIHSMP